MSFTQGLRTAITLAGSVALRWSLVRAGPPGKFFCAKVRDGWINAANDARTLDSTDQRLKPLGHIWKGARQAP